MNRSLLTALLAIVIPCAALAQSYPTKPIRIIVPFPPGAFNDTLGRIIAQKFSEGGIGQAFVDNRAGAGSTLGSDLAAKSPPDGHTLLEVAVPFAVNATLYTRLPYNTERDFTPVIFAGSTPNVLVVHPSVPVTTIASLIALAKAKPAQLNYASTGSGTSNHMSDGALQDDDGHGHRARAVQRQRAGAHGPDGRARHDDFRQHAERGAAY
jgi:tripartite-type tricarboxylate transporter receptor subunit TctC